MATLVFTLSDHLERRNWAEFGPLLLKLDPAPGVTIGPAL